MMLIKLTLTILVISKFVEPAKILGIFPINSENHYYLGKSLMKELANRGHDVTMVSPYGLNPSENYSTIDLGYAGLSFLSNMDSLSGSCSIMHIPYLHERSLLLTEKVLSTDSFQLLLRSNKKFDAVILEYTMNEALFGIGKIFNAPVVLFSPYSSFSLLNHLSANPSPVSFVPHLFSAYSGSMSYWERLSNLMYYHVDSMYRRHYSLPQQKQLSKQYLGHDIDFDQAIHNVSLVLLNSHPAVSEPVPKSPNMIEIAAFHIKDTYELAKDVKIFMDGASDGVIVYLDNGELSNDKVLEYFARIPQRILIRRSAYDETFNDDVASNIKFVNSLYLPAALGHQNTALVIFSSNYIHIIESVHAGVPIVIIDSEMDQNVLRAVRNGYAFFLDEQQIDSQIDIALDIVLANDWYRNNVKRRSRILRDQVVKPMDSAVFWIEYVIRNQGAVELKSNGIHLNWIQRNMVDVFILLLVIDVILFLIFYYIFKHIIHLIFKKFKNRESKKYDILVE